MTFNVGESSATLAAATVDDAVVEGASVVTAAIGSGADYAAAGGAGTASVSVEDNDLAPEPGRAQIPNANLRAAIERALGLAPGTPIAGPELAALERLDVSRVEVTDLGGLEEAVNLRELFLGANRVDDLSPLDGLPVSVRHTRGPGIGNVDGRATRSGSRSARLLPTAVPSATGERSWRTDTWWRFGLWTDRNSGVPPAV